MQLRNTGLLSVMIGPACCVGSALLALLGFFSSAGGSFSRFHGEFAVVGAVGVAAAWWQYSRQQRRLRAVAARMRNEGITRTILAPSTALIRRKDFCNLCVLNVPVMAECLP